MDNEKSGNKYLSILTNFGCHYSCPYCVVTSNGITIPKTTVEGLQGLEKAIVENECNWVSISGGGDPFYKLEEHTDWWNKLFDIVFDEDLDLKVELHTSYLSDTYDEDVTPFMAFDRVVYHCRNISDLFRIKRFNNQIVRVVYVVTEAATEDKINDIAAIVRHHPDIDELSFRQMIDRGYQTTHYCEDYLKAGHKKDWYYIEQGDYNLYYAENEVKTRYADYAVTKED
jgi:MoaA/NifB/PqqE/SkfB family radical SAM enzyme